MGPVPPPGITLQDDKPTPPAGAIDLLNRLHAFGWTYHLSQSHGIGTTIKPVVVYGDVFFVDVWGVKGDVRVHSAWIVRRDRSTLTGILGNWERTRQPVVTLRGECDPDQFAKTMHPRDPGPMASVKPMDLHRLIGHANPASALRPATRSTWKVAAR